MDYLYDGSFDGLLTCIYHHYYQETATGIYPSDCYQGSLITPSREITTDTELACRVYEGIEGKISREALNLVYRTFLSSHPEKERLILNYLQLGFKLGPRINSLLTHPRVHPLHEVAARVSREQHRFLGILRFSDTGPFLYAPCRPDHNILPLIADHFADRLKNESWVIHDQSRKIAVIHPTPSPEQQNNSWYLSDFPDIDQISLPKNDIFWSRLWMHYFREIGIAARNNPRAQAQFLPHRYRSYLPEFQSIYLQQK